MNEENIKIQTINGHKSLLVKNVTQSAYPPPKDSGYWRHMIPNVCPKTALILGVGAGTICHMLLEKCPKVKIIGVDNSQEVIQAAVDHMGLGDINMDLVFADAFDYVENCKDTFDLVIVDIFNGYWFPFRVLSFPFVTRCKELLTKNGCLYINTPNLEFAASLILKDGDKNDIHANIIYRYIKK